MSKPWRRVEHRFAAGRLPADEVKRLWALHRRNLARWPKSRKVDNRLVANYLYLAEAIANRMGQGLPDEVDVNDLFQDGVGYPPTDTHAGKGLTGAFFTFDPGRRVRFETYAALRIKGAMLDAVRERDWTPRLVRAREKKVTHARNRLRLKGREPTDEEVRKHLGMSREEWRRDNCSVGTTSINKTRFETDTGRQISDLELLGTEPVDAGLEGIDNRDLVARMLVGLNDTEKFIVHARYTHSMTMKATADCLGLSESRVSQMHTAIVQRLRKNHTSTYERSLQ